MTDVVELDDAMGIDDEGDTSVEKVKEGASRRKGRGFASDSATKDEVMDYEGIDREDTEIKARAGEPQRSVEGWILFITNVNEEATEDDVEEKFAEYGPIRNLNLNLDRRTGFLKGYALVEYATYKEASAAKDALDGSSFLGQNIQVNWAFVKGSQKGRSGRRRRLREPEGKRPGLMDYYVRECLYNNSQKLHANRQAAEKAWAEITDALGFDHSDPKVCENVKTECQSLRNSYQKWLIEEKADPPSGSKAPKKRELTVELFQKRGVAEKYSDELCFLKEHLNKHRRGSGNLAGPTSDVGGSGIARGNPHKAQANRNINKGITSGAEDFNTSKVMLLTCLVGLSEEVKASGGLAISEPSEYKRKDVLSDQLRRL
ncbi:unnamed protein product [Cyprideis torosa]|uniref:RNA-binding protein 8A n=1 Tax=Cyprideis torosa TaxID=163714 RepID=A0A7R8W0R4_9CRUS|nr:unnamed protein product [Cyprideis torosa]CAG0880021.1 unnamed protein product [Cyprideis torosa]